MQMSIDLIQATRTFRAGDVIIMRVRRFSLSVLEFFNQRRGNERIFTEKQCLDLTENC